MGYQNLITKLGLITLCFQCMVCMEPNVVVAECNTAMTTVLSCLGYVTGKAVGPTEECCNGVSKLKENQPVCLCFFIGQAHNDSGSIKGLGVQEAKLIQLSSVCHIANASIARCPKLLGISPSSPAAAIFTHNNMTSPTGATPSSSSTTSQGGDNSSGFKHDYGLLGGYFAVFVSTFLCVSQLGNLKFYV